MDSFMYLMTSLIPPLCVFMTNHICTNTDRQLHLNITKLMGFSPNFHLEVTAAETKDIIGPT